MKKIALCLFLCVTSLVAQSWVARVQILKGQAFLNRERLKVGQEINLAPSDTIRCGKASRLDLELTGLCHLSLKDSTELVFQDLYLQLRLGIMRLRLPAKAEGEQPWIVKTRQLQTAALQGRKSSDFALLANEDTTIIAVYQGDSLQVQRMDNGEKGLEILYLKPWQGFRRFYDQWGGRINWRNTRLDITIWGKDLLYNDWLEKQLLIDEAAFNLDSLISDGNLDSSDLHNALMKRAYFALYDNDQKVAEDAIRQVLTTNHEYQLPADLQSPKFKDLYYQVMGQVSQEAGLTPRAVSLWNPLVPGLTQLNCGQTLKGTVLLGTQMVLLAGFWYNQTRQADYENRMRLATTAADVDRYYQQSLHHYDRKQVFFYTALGVYAFNLLDAFHTRHRWQAQLRASLESINVGVAWKFE